MGVSLRAAHIEGRVESNSIVAKNILARSDVGRDGHAPRVVVGNHIVRGPQTGAVGTIDEPALVNLVEKEIGLVDSGAVISACGEEIHDGTMVRLGPVGPLDINT